MKKAVIILLLATLIGGASLAADPKVGIVLNPIPMAAFILQGYGVGGSVEVRIVDHIAVKGYFAIMEMDPTMLEMVSEENPNDKAVSGTMTYWHAGIRARYYLTSEGIRGFYAGLNAKYLSMKEDVVMSVSGASKENFSFFFLGPEIGYKFAKKDRRGFFFEPSVGYNFLLKGRSLFDGMIEDFRYAEQDDGTTIDLGWLGKFVFSKGIVANLTLGYSF